MSQSKQIKAKTLINFCGSDFLKFSKHRIFDKKKDKKVLDKTNSFTNSNCYNDKDTKAETTVDEDKDKLILRLNKRIGELESRIQFLQSSGNKNKEVNALTPKAERYLMPSNSAMAIKDKRNLSLLKKALTQNKASPNKSLQEKCFDRLKMNQLLNVKPFKKGDMKSLSVKLSIRKPCASNYVVSSIQTEQTIEPKCKEVIQYANKDKPVKLKREQSLDNIEGKSKLKTFIKNRMILSDTPGRVSNIKAIPKIPHNRNALNKRNNTVNRAYSIASTALTAQLNELKKRTFTLITDLIDMSPSNAKTAQADTANNNTNSIHN